MLIVVEVVCGWGTGVCRNAALSTQYYFKKSNLLINNKKEWKEARKRGRERGRKEGGIKERGRERGRKKGERERKEGEGGRRRRKGRRKERREEGDREWGSRKGELSDFTVQEREACFSESGATLWMGLHVKKGQTAGHDPNRESLDKEKFGVLTGRGLVPGNKEPEDFDGENYKIFKTF